MRMVILALVGLVSAGCGGSSSDGQSAVNENVETVYVDNGAVQCETAGLPPAETAQVLVDDGIDVISSACAYIDVEIYAECGLKDNNINLHTIPAQSLPDARALGYEPVASLRAGNEPGYIEISCSENE